MKDLAENGLTDLFEYGQDFMIGGNALGSGEPKANSTEEAQETFADKYRKELKKDVDDLGAEEESGDGDEADTEEATGVEDGGEEEVSSKDMFDEM